MRICLRQALLMVALMALAGAALGAPPARPGNPRPATPRASRPDSALRAAAHDSALRALAQVEVPADTLALALADSAIRAHGSLSDWRTIRDLEFTREVVQHGREGAIRTMVARHVLRVGAGTWSLRLETQLADGSRLVCVTTPDTNWATQDGKPMKNRRALTFAPIQMELDRRLLLLPWALRDPGVRLFSASDSSRPADRSLDCILSGSGETWRIGLDALTHRVVSVAWWHLDGGAISPEYRVVQSNFETHNGLALPGRQEIYDAREGRLLAEHTLRGYQLNVGFPDSLFQRP